MSTPKVQKFEHAEIRVNDLVPALEFYTGVMGLVEIAREDGTVYLGCGLDDNYDVAVVEKGTGVAHFAVRVESEEEIERHAGRLAEHGVETERTDGREPGQEKGLRFDLPSGHPMELVVVGDTGYRTPANPAHPRLSGIAPLDVDHINLAATDVKVVAEFLQRVLGFRLSDVSLVNPDFWPAAWSRAGGYHHDVAVLVTQDPGETLHHLAWAVTGIEDMKAAADMMAQTGTRVELGPSRHPVGSMLFMYFWEPGGNRFEFCAEGAVLDDAVPTNYLTGGIRETLDAWGTLHARLPETFMKGS